MSKKKRPASGGRNVNVVMKTAKGRKLSSTLWLQRQLNDPYVQRAQAEGYRSRAAYKLKELNETFKFLKPGVKVVDLGAAPGGWSQIASELTKADDANPTIISIDLLPIDPIPGVTIIQQDFTHEEAPKRIKELLGGKAEVVLSDIAPNTTGHTRTDHIRIMALCEEAYEFACEILAPGGCFIAKVLQGGTERELLNSMKQRFTRVKHAKPKASRAGSAEMYVVAMGFRSPL